MAKTRRWQEPVAPTFDEPYEHVPEDTPTRQHVSNWRLGVCKRCLRNNVRDGDIIVRIFGKGWWHDACFRIIRPDFYRGI